MVEVAKLAGVSQATVSKVVNGHRTVAPTTAQAVRRAMRKIGYLPPPANRRRGPRTRVREGIRTGCVALLEFGDAHQLHAGIFADQLRGVATALAEHHLSLVFAHVNGEADLPPLVEQDAVDGVLGMGRKPEPRVWAKLKRFPLVWVTAQTTPSNDHVLPGNDAVGRLALRYLIDRGHEHVACINPLISYPVYRLRSEGFQFQAQQAGVSARMLVDDPQPRLSIGELGFAGLEKLVEPLVDQWLQCSPRATGMFVPDDLLTALVYRVLRSRKIEPGRDVEIVSVANERTYLAGLKPRPATVDIGAETMGRRAVDQLLWRMRNPDEERQVTVTIDPVLIEAEQSQWQQHKIDQS